MPELLTTETAAAYVAEQLKGQDSLPIDLTKPLAVREIGDGNLNFAFHVHEAADPSRGVFVKQAPPYIKCLGEGFALHAERMLLESEVQAAYDATLAPGSVPRVFARDGERCAMVTEFLGGYELMRAALREGSFAERAASDIAHFMALTHSRTHARSPGGAAWAHLANAELCGITAEYVFSKPLDGADGTNRCSGGLADAVKALRADEVLCGHVLTLRDTFLQRKECLVHGDLHTGSVMVPCGGADGAAKVIDAEFAHYGCAAFDVGTFLAHLLFAAIARGVQVAPPSRGRSLAAASSPPRERRVSAARSQGTDARSADATWPPTELGATGPVHRMVQGAWESYVGGMRRATPPLLQSEAEEAEALALSCGFAGCELVRRVVGAAHVDDIECIGGDAKLRAEKGAPRAGRARRSRGRGWRAGVGGGCGACGARRVAMGSGSCYPDRGQIGHTVSATAAPTPIAPPDGP